MDVDAVADELYGLVPAEFTAARGARSKEARAAGDAEAARAIARLRRPTVVAWLANQLARRFPDQIGPLLELGEGLRAATATLSGPQLQQLSRQRHQLVHSMVQQAREVAREAGQRATEDVARGLEETLNAALADRDAGEQLRLGRLTEGLQHSGFGGPGDGVPAARAPARPKSQARAAPATATTETLSPADERRRAARRERVQRDLDRARRAEGRKAATRDAALAAAGQAAEDVSTAAGRVDDLGRELRAADADREKAEAQSARAQRTLETAVRAAEQAAHVTADLEAELEQL